MKVWHVLLIAEWAMRVFFFVSLCHRFWQQRCVCLVASVFTRWCLIATCQAQQVDVDSVMDYFTVD